MRRQRAAGEGFTLLEILLVLALFALLTGMVVPRFMRMAQGVEREAQRSDLHSAIEGLGYRAYTSGSAIVLTNLPEEGARRPGAPGPPIELPAGWRIAVERPIRFNANGVCGGGVIAIVDPDGRKDEYSLRAPLCALFPRKPDK